MFSTQNRIMLTIELKSSLSDKLRKRVPYLKLIIQWKEIWKLETQSYLLLPSFFKRTCFSIIQPQKKKAGIFPLILEVNPYSTYDYECWTRLEL